jgi:DNA polymerase III epsilon subunit family exonuclease
VPSQEFDKKGGSHRRGGRKGGSRRRQADEKPLPEVSAQHRSRLKATLDQGSFIIFDIETTGGNPEKNGITEIFALRWHKGQVGDSFYSLVNPGIPIPPIVRRMTGINNAMVKGAPPISKVMPEFIEFIGDDVLVSHNTIGDMKFVRHFAERHAKPCDNFFMCTHLLVEKLVSEAPDKSLKGLAKFFDLKAGDLHRAEADAWLTLELFKVLTRRLEDRSVRTIEAGIRLQGDLESSARLGWAIKAESIRSLPHGPGVYYLYDHERRLLFLSAASSVSRDVAKFERYSQVPRSLLRTVLKSYDIQVQRMPNIYAAMLHECEGVATSSLQFDPVDWHQRGVTALHLSEVGGVIKLGVGQIPEGTRHAWGPVRDRKVAHELLDLIAQTLGLAVQKHSVILSEHLVPVLTALIEGRLEDLIREDKRSLLSIRMLWQSERRKAAQQRLAFARKLHLVRVPGWLRPLLDQHGVIIVPDEGTGTWQVHTIIGARPRAVQMIRGDWEHKFHLAGFGKRILDRIAKEQASVLKTPLTALEAAKVNATLWWLQTAGQRQDGLFLSITQMVERLQKPPELSEREPSAEDTE